MESLNIYFNIGNSFKLGFQYCDKKQDKGLTITQVISILHGL